LLEVHVAVYFPIALPLLTPAAKVTVSEPVVVVVEPDAAFTPVGGAGEPTITGPEEADAGLAPTTLVAVTVHR